MNIREFGTKKNENFSKDKNKEKLVKEKDKEAHEEK
jgi:hypothetical protein